MDNKEIKRIQNMYKKKTDPQFQDYFHATRKSFGLWLSLIISVIFLHGCAFYSSSNAITPPVEKNCVIPSDQSKTISGRWSTYPIPIAFFSGNFGSGELSAITKAADTWNTFFNSSQSVEQVINYGTSDSPTPSSAINPASGGSVCAQGIIQGSTYRGNVVLYKLTSWPSAYSNSAIALTTFCTLPAQPIPKFYMAIIEFNYQGFFANGTRQPDLESIILHEFGHMIGLNHSCENTTRTGVPNCADPNINSDYLSASMFPAFAFDQTGAGEVRNNLNSNDQGRANCIYQNSVTSTTSTSLVSP